MRARPVPYYNKNNMTTTNLIFVVLVVVAISASTHGFQPPQPHQRRKLHQPQSYHLSNQIQNRNQNQNPPFQKVETKRKSSKGNDVTDNTATSTTTTSSSLPLSPPTFLQALWGIATTGSPWEYMLTLRSYGYDGIVPINLGLAGVYNFLLSPESVRSATLEEAPSLPRRFSVPLFETLELDKGLVYEQGTRHAKHKKICIPSFEQTTSMETYVDATRGELTQTTNRFMQAIQENSSSGSPTVIDLYAEMRKSTLNVILAVTFGLGGTNNDDNEKESFQRADELSQTIGEYLERIVALANEIPPLWQISPRLSSNYVRVTDVLLPTLRELVAEVIAARRLDDKDDNAKETMQQVQDDNDNADQKQQQRRKNKADLLSVLVEQPDLTDNDIRSILFDVVIAGSDTTASTTTAALYVLHEPQNQKWLQAALQEAIDQNGGDSIPLSKLRSELPVATSIAREILRLYPPVPFVGRTATQTGTLCNGQYPIEIGDTFCFSPWYLGRDPYAWGTTTMEKKNDHNNHTDEPSSSYETQKQLALTFNPQRWIDDPFNGGAPTVFSWLPFGAGPRGCLGTRLGLTEVTLGISRLLRDFTFDFKQTGPLPVKYDLTLNLDGVMNCNIMPREKTST